MGTRKELERQIEIAEDALRKARLELAKTNQPVAPGTRGLIARWSKKFKSSPATYNYAAIASHGYWYTSSTAFGARKFSWKEMLEEVERDVDGIISLTVNDFSSGEFVKAWRYAPDQGWTELQGNDLLNAPVPF